MLNKFSVKIFVPYLIIGLFMWFFTYKSGIHATIAGVLLASTIPHRIKDKDFSLLVKIEHAISPYVAFMIMPLFAGMVPGRKFTAVVPGCAIFTTPQTPYAIVNNPIGHFAFKC